MGMIRITAAALAAAFVAAPAFAAEPAKEPDGLVLPKGFHASMVAEGLGPIRHMAVRGNDIYVSTRHGANQPSVGLIALRLLPDHTVLRQAAIPNVDQGTGI